MRATSIRIVGAILWALFLAPTCKEEPERSKPRDDLTGRVDIDGSSTVFPVQEAVAEDFEALHPNVEVSVGFGGTVSGIRDFCQGLTDLSDASRAMNGAEARQCRGAGVSALRFNIGWDGISVVVNAKNSFARCLTLEELRRIWEPGSTIRSWHDVRADWPEEEIHLYGPGSESGTFEYFTEAVVGSSGASRIDYASSEDDNLLVEGIAQDEQALGYFGYAYYVENEEALRLIALDAGAGCVTPSDETIGSGEYSPLVRPLFVYAKTSAIRRPEVRAYLEYMLSVVPGIIKSAGYHPLSPDAYAANAALLREAVRTTG